MQDQNIGELVAQFIDGNPSLPSTGDYGQSMGRPQPQQAQSTCMRACSATSCAHICQNGQCSLEVIDINEHGGCAMYEATAENCESEGSPDEGRYDEEPQSNSTMMAQISQIANSMF